MKIVNWNLERGGKNLAARAAQDVSLEETAADVLVLTEPYASITSVPNVVTSQPLRAGRRGWEPWVAIKGPKVERMSLEIPYERLACAAHVDVEGRSLVVYASVLPWLSISRHAPYVVRGDETSEATFDRVLSEQVADIERLQRSHGQNVVWAGDFNQTLVGSPRGGSYARRALLVRALERLGMVAWNRGSGHACPDLAAVDLICGAGDVDGSRVGRIAPIRGDIVMSDHAGYWVDL